MLETMADESSFLPRGSMDRLLAALQQAGYRCIGPTVHDGTIVYQPLRKAADLPEGWQDRQGPGVYRLERTDSPRAFSWAVGPQALKPLLFAPRESLWRVVRDASGRLSFEPTVPEPPRLAVLGARACDLAALELQDQHFLEGRQVDPYYAARRERLFIIAVHCTHPADTCFCASTGDGPHAESGFDLALHELDEGYLVEPGSERGAALLAGLDLGKGTALQRERAQAELERAASRQSRHYPLCDMPYTLLANLDNARWDDVAERCLACGNCTSVCPTCFCHAETEEPALSGETSEHLRVWDSCFTAGHSYVAGTVLRAQTKLRYRQWLLHKLATWHEQYGRSGCVGCGRCITWCPVGIDITEEAHGLCGEPTR